MDSKKIKRETIIQKKHTEEVVEKSDFEKLLKKAGYCPGYTHSSSDPFIKKIAKLLERHQLQPKFFWFSGISDANVLNSKGIKTVVFSDGVNSPHTTQENISIDSLYKMSNIISAIIYTKW